MAEPTELKPLKRSIPPDVQKQVEDIQKKVARTTGPLGNINEEKKRWLIVGICLHSIISPLLRKYVDPIMSNLYTSLVSSDSIDTQGYHRYLKKYPATNRFYLNYESINNNRKLNKNYRSYDYKVTSYAELSKVFLQPSMAHYSAIDGTCDLSALLGMVINISSFPRTVQKDADKIRLCIRNPWAHCDFTEWTTANYTDAFKFMAQFVKDLGLSSEEENTILGELNTWATHGHNYLSGTVLGLEIVEEIREQTHVLSEYVQTLCTETDSQFIKVQKEMKNLENSLQDRIRKLENKTDNHEVRINACSEQTTCVSRKIEDLEVEIKKQEDNIPNNIMDQHSTHIQDWKNDKSTFLETRATTHILTSLSSTDCIIVTGSPGCGKSSNIHYAALHLHDRYGYVIIPVLTGPTDILNYYNKNKKQVFVVDDICGKETMNILTLQLWRDYSEKLEKIFTTVETEVENKDNSNILEISGSKLLISCRLHIYKESQFQLVQLLTRKECNVLSPELCLLQEEKIHMAKKYFPDNIIDLVMEVEENIEFFPFLCKMSKNKTSEEVIKLFTSPTDSIGKNITHIILEKEVQFCALVLCILYDDGFNTNWLKLKSILEVKQKNKLEDIVKEFKIDLSIERSRNTLKEGFATLDGTYLRRRGTEYRIIHDIINEVAAVICGKKLTECFIKYAPSVFIRDHFILESINDAPVNDNCIMLSGDVEEEYFERLLNDLKESIIMSTFHNKQLIYKPFREKLIRTFEKSDEAKQVLKDFDPKDNKMKTDEYFIDWYLRLTTPLIEAVSCGYCDLVHFLIDTVKCDMNIRDKRGRSLLYKASEGGKTDVVKLLLQNNIDMSNCQTYGSCPLYVACEKGYKDVVDMLLQNYHHVSQCQSYGLCLVECVNGHTSNTFTEHSRFCPSVCRRSHFRTPPYRNPRSRDFVCNCQQGGEFPLHIACKRGHLDSVKLLLQNNANVSLYNSLGETPLYTACEGGHKDIVKLLLQNKAAVSQLGMFKKSSLHAAYNGEHTDIMEMLLRNSDVSNDFDENEICIALWEACEKGHTKLVELLLKKTVDINRCDTTAKRTLLHVVCSRGHASIVNLLLKNKAKISQCNSKGETPLYLACAKGHTDIVTILLQNKADIAQYKSDGESPIYVACANGHTDIVNILLQNKADIAQYKNDGESPLYAACANGHTDIVNMLLQNKADIAQYKSDGESSLYAACANGHTDIVIILLQNKADISQCKSNEESPLYVVSAKGHTDIVNILMQNMQSKADFFRYGNNLDMLELALQAASANGHTDIVNILMQNTDHVS